MLSLKTNIRIAADAPNPAKRVAGDLLTRIAIMTMPPTKKTSTCNTCIKPFIGLFFIFSCWLNKSSIIKRLSLIHILNWASKDYTHLSFRGGREIADALLKALLSEKDFYDEAEKVVN